MARIRKVKLWSRRSLLLLLLVLHTTCISSMFFLVVHDSWLKSAVNFFAAVAPVLPNSSRDINRPRPVLFPNKSLVIWTISNHPSPAADIQQLLEPLGVRFKIFTFNNCERFGQCESRKKLKVLSTQQQSFYLNPPVPQQFYDAYKDDPEMHAVDAFLCYDPAAMCELYPPFNKSVIVVASNRYHLARESVERWTAWNNLLRRWAAHPKNFIGANGPYDAHFMRYYTGIDTKVIPSYCNYTGATFEPRRPEFVIAKKSSPGFVIAFLQEFKEASESIRSNATLSTIDKLYGRYSYSDLAAHSGIVHIPYQVSTMSIFEQYRMAIPLFFPTKRLLLEWNLNKYIMYERTWEGWATREPRDIPADPTQTHTPTPNNNHNATAMKYWIEFCDWYQWPHIIYFDSVLELAKLLNTLTVDDLLTISEKMKRYSATVRE